MSEQFKRGDICIGQYLVSHAEYNGCECTILEGPSTLKVRNNRTGGISTGLHYIVQFEDGAIGPIKPFRLRKKQPPRSAKSIMREAILKAKQPQEVGA